MPELPEVEVVKRGLSSLLGDDATIEEVKYRRRNLREELPSLRVTAKIKGARILRIQRRAKYLIFQTDKGAILSHLGMTGTWRLDVKDVPELREHDHVVVRIKGLGHLIYRDPRRFGYFDIFFTETHPKLAHLGLEPWDKALTSAYLLEKFKNKKTPIKVAIMDQEILVGVGNIYASEALFMAKISPLKPANKVRDEDLRTLLKSIRKVLEKSIESGGSTISDFAQAGGDSGYFQTQFKVYGRSGEACLKCKHSKIKQKTLGGRSTFWCPTCQKP